MRKKLDTTGVVQIGQASGPYQATMEDGGWLRIDIALIPNVSYWTFRIPVRDILALAEEVKDL